MLVPGLTARFFGNYRNDTTRYYWVQAVLPNGRSAITGPAVVTGPSQLNSNNFVEISWREVPGAIAYDVIITTTSSTPSGTLTTGGVILGTSKLSWNDVGSYVSWTITPNPSVPSTTDDLLEGVSNLYYTDVRVLAELATLLAQKQSVIAAGTVYTITATQAAVDFGTTDPGVTLGAIGTYLILARARVDNVGATYSANRTVTLKVRRTNNTPADVAGTSMVIQTGIITTTDDTAGNVFSFALYTTTNTNDALALFAGIDVVASAGTSVVSDAAILVIRIA